jgi:hypothetical protein
MQSKKKKIRGAFHNLEKGGAFYTKEVTASSMEKPLVHLMRVPEAIEDCLTGNEKVKPSSL